jgi:hypothetical protein
MYVHVHSFSVRALGAAIKGIQVQTSSRLGGFAGQRVCRGLRSSGAGLDLERIRRKAVERGVIAADRAARMQDRDIFNLIQWMCFSTPSPPPLEHGLLLWFSPEWDQTDSGDAKGSAD